MIFPLYPVPSKNDLPKVPELAMPYASYDPITQHWVYRLPCPLCEKQQEVTEKEYKTNDPKVCEECEIEQAELVW